MLISTAWATRPYTIGSLLFNSMYLDTVPMASHYLGEQALQKAAATNREMNYVVLRAMGLNSDENYAKSIQMQSTRNLPTNKVTPFSFLVSLVYPACREVSWRMLLYLLSM